VDGRRCGAFDRNLKKRILTYLFLPLVADRSQTLLCLFVYYMNIQKVSSSRLYNWLYGRLYNRLQSVNGPWPVRCGVGGSV